ncbi:hypothetical protein ACFL0D_02715 [Thermoproteota archaeon]
MKIKTRLTIVALTLIILSTVTVSAAPKRGTIRIDPNWEDDDPVILEGGSAEFEIYVTEHAVSHAKLFLVMSQACNDGLTGDVEVDWNGLVGVSEWSPASSGKIPDEYAVYTVASLRDHLGVPSDETIYWALTETERPIDETPDTFTVSLPSNSPRMLIYAIGGNSPFDNKVPPTRPGFVIPELPLGTLSSIATMIGSYVLLRRKKK